MSPRSPRRGTRLCPALIALLLAVPVYADTATDTTVTRHPLQFRADTFAQSGDTLTATGAVRVGFVPKADSTFTPLLLLEKGVVISGDSTQGQFTSPGNLAAIVHADTTIIYKDSLTIGIAAVAGGGIALTDNATFTVAGLQFQPEGLSLSDSTSSVKLQGALTINHLDSLKIAVDQDNYVLIDSTGITLTGISASISKDFTAYGLSFDAEALTVAYHHAPDTNAFSIYGNTKVSPTGHDDTLRVALGTAATPGLSLLNGTLVDLSMGLAADTSFSVHGLTIQPDTLGLTLIPDSSYYAIAGTAKVLTQSDTIAVALGSGSTPGITIEDGTFKEAEFGFSGTFTVHGLTVKPSNLSFEYVADSAYYAIYGDAAILTKTDTISVLLGTEKVPGLKIENDTFIEIDFGLSTTEPISISSLKLQPDSLTFAFVKDSSHYALYGGSKAFFDQDTVDVFLGTLTQPGIVIERSTIQDINIHVTGDLKLGSLSLQPDSLGIRYVATGDTLQVTGSVKVKELWNATGSLPDGGLLIVDGKLTVKGLDFDLSNADVGAFEIKDLNVAFVDTSDVVDVDACASLVFPGGWGVQGQLDIEDGSLNGIALDFLDTKSPIPIGDTGLSLWQIGASVENLHTPSNLVVSGCLGVELPDEPDALSLADTTASSTCIPTKPPPCTLDSLSNALLGAVGSFAVDRNELKLDAQVELMVGTETLGRGSADLDLNWGAGQYKVGAVWGVADCGDKAGTCVFNFDLGFHLNSQGDFTINGDADVQVPYQIPVIGGDTLGSIDFYMQRLTSDPDSDFAAAWLTVDLGFWHPEVGFKYAWNADEFSIIGANGIKQIGADSTKNSDQTYTYNWTAAVPTDSATHLTMHARWLEYDPNQSIAVTLADGMLVEESDFSLSDNGIRLEAGLSSDTSATVFVVNPDTTKLLAGGDYILSLTTSKAISRPDTLFHAHWGMPKPAISVDSVTTRGKYAALHYTSSSILVDQTEVRLYLDWDSTGYDGAVITPALGATPYQTGKDSMLIDMSTLIPLPYYVYGIIHDGVNVPVKSEYITFTPEHRLYGNITDQTNTLLGGWNVTVTGPGVVSPDTTYRVTTTINGTWGLPAHIPDGWYTVALEPEQGYLPYKPPAYTDSVHVQGPDPFAVDFELQRLASVSGTVYTDENGNGTQDPGEPGLPNMRVYMNQSSTVTNTSGGYIFFFDCGSGADTTCAPIPYEITFPLPDSLYLTSDSTGYSGSITSALQAITGDDFGVQQYGSLSGIVYNDANGNDQQDAGESGLSGWTVTLQSEGTSVAQDTTDSTGAYAFDRLRVGTYTVAEDTMPGWTQTQPVIPVDSMAAPTTLSSSLVPSADWLTVADLTGNDTLDIAFVAPHDQEGQSMIELTWLNGQGDGTFAVDHRTQIRPSDCLGPLDPLALLVTSGDLDGDGQSDLIITYNIASTYSGLAALFNKGGGQFSSSDLSCVSKPLLYAGGGAPYPILLANLDNSDQMNLISMAWTAPFSDTPLGAYAISTPDESAAHFHTLSGVLQDSLPYNLLNELVTAMTSADFNQDDHNDIAYLIAPDGKTLTLNMSQNVDGYTFTTTTIGSAGTTQNPASIVTADFNADGNVDIATGGSEIMIWLSDSTGTFTGADTTLAVPDGAFLVAGDIENDGHIDLVELNSGIAFYNNGEATFRSKPLGAKYTSGVLVDLDGDGRLEIVGISDNKVLIQTSATTHTYTLPLQSGEKKTNLNFGNRQ